MNLEPWNPKATGFSRYEFTCTRDLLEIDLLKIFKAKPSINRLTLLVVLPFILAFGDIGTQSVSAGEGEEYSSQSRQIFLNAVVEKTKVPLNELIWLIVRIGWVGNIEDMEIAPPEFDYLDDFKIMETSSWKLRQEKEGPLVVSEYRFLLKPLILGIKREIPPMTIQFRESADKSQIKILSTRPLQVEVIKAEKILLSKLSITGIAIGLFSLIFLLVFALTFIRKTYQKEIYKNKS